MLAEYFPNYMQVAERILWKTGDDALGLQINSIGLQLETSIKGVFKIQGWCSVGKNFMLFKRISLKPPFVP